MTVCNVCVCVCAEEVYLHKDEGKSRVCVCAFVCVCRLKVFQVISVSWKQEAEKSDGADRFTFQRDNDCNTKAKINPNKGSNLPESLSQQVDLSPLKLVV